MWKAIKQFRAALSLVSPEEIRRRAERQVLIGLVAGDERGYAELEDFLAPSPLPSELRQGLLQTTYRAGQPDAPPEVDFVLYAADLPCPHGTFRYDSSDEELVIQAILDAHDELALPLARHFPVFRKPVVDRLIQAVSRENALFALASALPNVVPNLFELPWTFGEFASDTVFLTLNQCRMALLIAAACGAEVGFSAQKAELVSITAGAFGWRAIARELAGKIPLGGGLIPKGAIAYAATFAIGKGLEYLHHANVPFTSDQHTAAYEAAFERGKAVAESLAKEVG
jgi:hypothetical protein